MKRLSLLALLFAVLGLGIWWLSADNGRDDLQGDVLEVHCAAGLRLPVEEIASDFEKAFGVKVKLSYGGSGELLGKLSMAGGDLYIPADASYTDDAQARGLTTEVVAFAHLTAGIMVRRDNPLGIEKLADLTQKDLRLALAEKSAAVGRFTHKVLEEARVLEQVKEGEFSTMPTVNAVANAVKLNSADAGIVWDCLMSQYPDHEFIRVPEFSSRRKTSTVGVLDSSRNPTLALRFARYLSARDKGGKVLAKHGFEQVEKGE